MATEARVTAVIEAKDQATGVLNSVSNSFMGFNSKAVMATAALTAVGTAAYGFTSQALKAAASWEQVNVAFTTMLGSADNAKVFMNELVAFAKTTPFTLTGLQEASKQLLAYGSSQEEVIPQLRMLGDIASGVGMDKLPNLILAFGQVRAATRLTGMELRQFTEAGVPLLQTLADQFKKPVSEIQEMVSAGQIGFADVQKALQGLTGEGGRFNNLMENQSKTLSGMVSNLQDAWNIFLTQQGARLIEWAKAAVGAATQVVVGINSIGDVMRDLGARIDRATGLISLFKMQWESVGNNLRENLLPAFTRLWESLEPLMPFLKALATVIGATLVGAITLLTQTLTLAVNLFVLILTTATNVATFFTSTFSGAIDWIIDKLSNLILKIQEAIDWFSKLSISSSLQSTGDKITGGLTNFGHMLGFASGGIVPGPLGSAQLAVVHGGERVITPSGLSAAGGGVVVNISGNTISNDMDMRQLADQVGREVMRALRRAQNI